MNNLVIFDLDGVLLDSRIIHFHSLNNAIERVAGSSYTIQWDEHLAKYDGLPTTKKLKLLTEEKGLPEYLRDEIWKSKQRFTVEEYDQYIHTDEPLVSYFKDLQRNNIKIAVASNSIRKTLIHALTNLGVIRFVDYFVSNEDVKHPKPNPEMYFRCMIELDATPDSTRIVEDSHIGRLGALLSKGHLYPVYSRDDITPEFVKTIIHSFAGQPTPHTPWINRKMNVLIPMAGRGSRFEKVGYTFPKPLIDVQGKPMIKVVVDNLNISAHYIFIVQKSHYEKYNLKYLLELIAPGCDIIQVDGVTEGAACTTLLAESFINNDLPLLIANSDQVVEWNSNEVLYAFSADGIDAGVVTFNSCHPKWSFVKLNDDGFVIEVAEKKPISEYATCGIYYWKRGSDYVKYARQMIEANDRTNGEFYVAPVFNYAIRDGKKIRIKEIEKMHGIGTPEDLDLYLEQHPR